MARRPNAKWKGGFRKVDSKFEKDLLEGVLKDCEFHTERIPYTIEHTYQPDFVHTTKDGYTYLIESKGRFMDSSEASKYKWIREALPERTELVFLFQKPTLAFPNAKVRKKCGTKKTHLEWAELNNFKWFDKNTIKEIVSK